MIWIASDLEHIQEPERTEWKGRPLVIGGKVFKPLTPSMFKALQRDQATIRAYRERFTLLLCAIHDQDLEKIYLQKS